jgi:hypothetical protein
MNYRDLDLQNRLPVSVATMLEAVASESDLILSVTDYVGPQVRTGVPQLRSEATSNISAVGCGDPLYAAMAT